jgi:hypothetical protein
MVSCDVLLNKHRFTLVWSNMPFDMTGRSGVAVRYGGVEVPRYRTGAPPVRADYVRASTCIAEGSCPRRHLLVRLSSMVGAA